MKERLVQKATFVARPFLQMLPAGRVRVLGWLNGGQGSNAWDDVERPLRIWWDANLQAYVETDLRDWVGRWHYFSGHHYDRVLPSIMKSFLRRGDTYVDVGANVGLHVIRAAGIVGSEGIVHAVEPAPATMEKLKLHLSMNGIRNVNLHNCAAGSRTVSARLSLDPRHSGTATLRDNEDKATVQIDVPVHALDELISLPDDGSRALVKIDVEGFELEAVRGARELLRRRNTSFVIEVTPQWIESAGGNAEALFRIFQAEGYGSFVIARRRRWYQEEATLREVRDPGRNQADYLFVRAGEARWAEPLMRT